MGKRLYSDTSIFSVKIPIPHLKELFINHENANERTVEITEGVILSKKITLSQLISGDWNLLVYIWDLILTFANNGPYVLVFFGTISEEMFEEVTLFIQEVIKLYFENESNEPIKNESTEIKEKVEKMAESNEKPDMVNHPPHYMQCSFECIEVMQSLLSDEQFFGYCIANSLKYLWRFKFKNHKEDIEKAKWYIDRSERCNSSIFTENRERLKFIKALYDVALSKLN